MRSGFAIMLVLFAAVSAHAATFRSDSTAIVHAKDTTLSGWTWKVFIFDVSGNKIGDASANNPAGTSVFSADLNGTANQVTMSSDFYLAWGAAYGGLYSTGSHSGKPDWVPMGWISAYEVGGTEQQSSASGPYVGNNPQNADGSPANPVTAAPVVKSYKASVSLSCPASAVEPRMYRVVGITNGDNKKIFDEVVTVNPGETRIVTVTHNAPFDLFSRQVVENIALDPELSPGAPEDPDQRYLPVGPLQSQAATPQSADPPPSGNPEATNTRDSQTGSAAQPAASQNAISTAGTGATSKDISDLSKNITEELKRGTEQTRQSGDATKNAIGDGNKLLKDIKDGKGGDNGTGPDMEVSTPGSLSFVAGIPGDATTLGGALTNLINATGLAAGVGSSTLIWTYEFPVLGVQTINFEAYADVIANVRLFIRWCLSVLFIWQVFTIVREAFSK